jgi:hypothetical protein
MIIVGSLQCKIPSESPGREEYAADTAAAVVKQLTVASSHKSGQKRPRLMSTVAREIVSPGYSAGSVTVKKYYPSV